MIVMGGPIIFGTRWKGAFGTFMISRPTLSCSYWLEFVHTECFHDVIYVLVMLMFNDDTSFFLVFNLFCWPF